MRHSHIDLKVNGETVHEYTQRQKAYESIHELSSILPISFIPSLIDIVYEYFWDSVSCVMQRHGLDHNQIDLFASMLARMFRCNPDTGEPEPDDYYIRRELWVYGECDIGRHIIQTIANATTTKIVCKPELFSHIYKSCVNFTNEYGTRPVFTPMIYEWHICHLNDITYWRRISCQDEIEIEYDCEDEYYNQGQDAEQAGGYPIPTRITHNGFYAPRNLNDIPLDWFVGDENRRIMSRRLALFDFGNMVMSPCESEIITAQWSSYYQYYRDEFFSLRHFYDRINTHAEKSPLFKTICDAADKKKHNNESETLLPR